MGARRSARFNGAGDVHRRRAADALLQSASRDRSRFNGAGDVHRRRALLAELLGRAAGRLQRGRRRSSPESAAATCASQTAGRVMLQRGRRRSSPERRLGRVGRRRRMRASTGPVSAAGADGASTGPATFIAGEGERRGGMARSCASSFNGAGDVHRRRADHERTRCGHEPTTLQRGRRRSSPERRPRLCRKQPKRHLGFNGAGDVHRRRDQRQETDADAELDALQRGRRRSSPERDSAKANIRPNPSASTGPATFIAGEDLAARRCVRRGCASTGPATFIAGETDMTICSAVRLARFNGAGDVHRRRGRRACPRCCGRRLASTGPATFIAGEADRAGRPVRWPLPLQRGRRRSSPESSRAGRVLLLAHRRFNGAGDVHRRRVPRAWPQVDQEGALQRGRRRSSPEREPRARVRTPRREDASTGPATFIAGERHPVASSVVPAVGLQRGRRRSSPERRVATEIPSSAGKLQRGRRRSSPERTSHPPPAARRTCRASTGPATFIAGESTRLTTPRSGAPRLQQGRRRSSPESTGVARAGLARADASTGPATFIAGEAPSASPRVAEAERCELQRGRRRSSPESGRARSDLLGRLSASTGPATFIAGESTRPLPRLSSVLASTGPATFIAGESFVCFSLDWSD